MHVNVCNRLPKNGNPVRPSAPSVRRLSCRHGINHAVFGQDSMAASQASKQTNKHNTQHTCIIIIISAYRLPIPIYLLNSLTPHSVCPSCCRASPSDLPKLPCLTLYFTYGRELPCHVSRIPPPNLPRGLASALQRRNIQKTPFGPRLSPGTVPCLLHWRACSLAGNIPKGGQQLISRARHCPAGPPPRTSVYHLTSLYRTA